MGGLTTALLAATSGLRAAQTGIDLVSRNVSNATTPGRPVKSSADFNAASTESAPDSPNIAREGSPNRLVSRSSSSTFTSE